MNRNNVCWRFANDASIIIKNNDILGLRLYAKFFIPGNVRFNLSVSNGHHRDRSGCRKPIGFVVSRSVVANVVKIAKQEWHC